MTEKVTCYLYVWRDNKWQLVGQYATTRAARNIERDYQSRGYKTKVVKED